VRAIVDDVLGERNVASHESVADLQARVAALEHALARAAGPPAP
jgi:hypothetical protein